MALRSAAAPTAWEPGLLSNNTHGTHSGGGVGVFGFPSQITVIRSVNICLIIQYLSHYIKLLMR